MAVGETPSGSDTKEQRQAKQLLHNQEAMIKQQKELQAQVLAVGGIGSATNDKGKGRGRKGKEGEAVTEEQRKIEDAVLARRDANGKPPCFWHYSKEGCRRDKDCDFSHTIDLNDAERAAVTRLATRRARSRSASRERKGKGGGKQGGKGAKGK